MKVSYKKAGVGILIFMICIATLSSCGLTQKCRYNTYMYFKPRINKTPYASIAMRQRGMKTPLKFSINNYVVPDSVFTDYTFLHIEINKYKGFYLIEINKNIFDETRYSEAPANSRDFQLIDTIYFNKSNLLKIKTEREDGVYDYEIDLNKGRCINLDSSGFWQSVDINHQI